MIRIVNGLLVIIFDIKCINGLVYDELACIVSYVCVTVYFFKFSHKTGFGLFGFIIE